MAYTERYVTSGAGGGGDGSSGSPWTLAEAFSNAVAGDRVNIQSDAGYSIGAGAITNAGAFSARICFRGYNSTIGDLDSLARNSDTTLDVTNFPIITVTATRTFNAFVILQNLVFTGALTGYIFNDVASDYIKILNCSMMQTSKGGVAKLDNDILFVNSDFTCENSTHSMMLEIDQNVDFIGCRIEGNSSSATLLSMQYGIVDGCAFLGGSSAVAINMETNTSRWMIKNNTFYGLGTAIQIPNSAQQSEINIINNHVTDCAKYIDSLYSSTADYGVIEVAFCSRVRPPPRTGISDEVLLVGEITTDTGGASTDLLQQHRQLTQDWVCNGMEYRG